MNPTPVAADKQGTMEDPNHPLNRLTPEQVEELGRELQAIHDEVFAELGATDAAYIRRLVKVHRRLAALSRIALMNSRFTPMLVAGTAGLSVAKILENMELGHNILHGQWDWMNDPKIHSSTWDWDNVTPSSAWKHSHNFVHHTYTNVLGKDRDVGYDTIRIDHRQRWKPAYLAQPAYNVLLAMFFEWGIAIYDLDFPAVRRGASPRSSSTTRCVPSAARPVGRCSRTTSPSRC
ncbi:fatty acid desaturase family protein [Nocardioides sp. CF8]|uniref:fatty acid desaturase family protein n=1 Tax=Nocardioides sp. CF8 TaxID=110319 RepID=UPI0004265D32|nr:fatty acid desaturase [Nocardioides sp. CF8]